MAFDLKADRIPPYIQNCIHKYFSKFSETKQRMWIHLDGGQCFLTVAMVMRKLTNDGCQPMKRMVTPECSVELIDVRIGLVHVEIHGWHFPDNVVFIAAVKKMNHLQVEIFIRVACRHLFIAGKNCIANSKDNSVEKWYFVAENLLYPTMLLSFLTLL